MTVNPTVNPPKPANCKLSPWSSWSGCRGSCHRGGRFRSRTILQKAEPGGKPCPDIQSLIKWRRCKLPKCPSQKANGKAITLAHLKLANVPQRSNELEYLQRQLEVQKYSMDLIFHDTWWIITKASFSKTEAVLISPDIQCLMVQLTDTRSVWRELYMTGPFKNLRSGSGVLFSRR